MTRPERDRDLAGRPRNARPRDVLGRPLPRDAAGTPPADAPALPPAAALAETQRLLAAGRPFAAHEVCEAVWKAAPPAERDLWQGLAQLWVGLTHAQRGNARGSATLLRRGAQRLAGYAARPAPYGIPVAALVTWAEAAAAQVDAQGVADAPPPPLTPQPPGPQGPQVPQDRV